MKGRCFERFRQFHKGFVSIDEENDEMFDG